MDEPGVVVRTKLAAPGTWVSFVGAVLSVLLSRKVKRELSEVAGLSGYAFLVNVHPQLCPSGPTAFDWEMLIEGTSALGLEVELVAVPHSKEDDTKLMRELFERVKAEVDAGRCCVVWGATCAPEFAVVYGYQGESYLVRSFRTCRALAAKARGRLLGPDDSPEDPVPFDRLEAPGCISAFFFGPPALPDKTRADRAALTRAVHLLRDRHTCYMPEYAHGADAFKTWADALTGHTKDANAFGNAYNALCYQELHELGAGFLRLLKKRHKSAAEPLTEAAGALGASAANLSKLTKLFPFPEGKGLDDAPKVREAAALLRECAELNSAAAGAMERALGLL